VRLLLDESGKYVACTVIDPRRALETGRSFKPDLVLVDLIMPGADGHEVAAQLEADWALHGVPIVFLTSLITAEEGNGWPPRLWTPDSAEADKQVGAD
jgi:CheY-like chemotaxis protein